MNALSAGARASLWPILERVTVERKQVLSKMGAPSSHFYFVESGMVSLIKTMREGHGVEINAVGYEGIAPPGAVFDLDHAVLDSVVQIGGSMLCVRREEIKERLKHDRELRDVIHKYVAVALSQFAQTAACNILHSVEERCCRWLLMAHDSARFDKFPLTHEYLGMMLGVRRASVSVAVETLQRSDIICCGHGSITVTNRAALEAAACECYGTIRSEFDVLFGREGNGAGRIC